MPNDHPLTTLDTVRPEDLHGAHLIALTHRHARRAQLDKVLTSRRSRPHVIAEASTSFAAVDLVREGLGVTIINPFPVAHYRSSDVTFRLFASPITYRSYFATPEHRPTPSIARSFMRHLRLHTPKIPFTKRAS